MINLALATTKFRTKILYYLIDSESDVELVT